MESNALKVTIWGTTVGFLSWNEAKQRSVFLFDKEFINKKLDISPIHNSIYFPSANLQQWGNTDKLYKGLPPFIADSLPDNWGNSVFDAWAKKNNISAKHLTPLDRLSFIGSRGMGALEFEPAQFEHFENKLLKANELYQIALEIKKERSNVHLSIDEVLIEDMYRVGTSAGGKRAKAIIAMNKQGDICSGQIDLPNDYIYYILKFNDDDTFPFSNIEMAYYQMACDAGITMMPSRLVTIEQKEHFLTERFDRRNGEKLHILTLAAMDCFATSYEDLFAVCRKLHLPESQIDELYTRMVFNVLAKNIDDHSKNFSFIMDNQGHWSLSPAYDIIFSLDTTAPDYVNVHSLSIGGKTKKITLADLATFAQKNDIKNHQSAIEKVLSVVAKWKNYATNNNVPTEWIENIDTELKNMIL